MSRAYSVDETSGLLGIPRPTLYRYLREYSIPNVRKSGRISIPEDSVEKIRRVRDLHREGMGTGSVRRLISEPQPRDADEAKIASRLDRITQELEGVKVEGRLPESLSSEQAIRTILARQTMLISAVINLTDMVEDMMRSNGNPPRRQSDSVEVDIRRYAGKDTSREVALTGGHRSVGREGFSREGLSREGGTKSGRVFERGKGRGKASGSPGSGFSPAVRMASRPRTTTVQRSASSPGAARGASHRERVEGSRPGSSYGSLARRRRRIVGGLFLAVAVVVLGVILSSLV